MSDTFTLKRGDREPALQCGLLYADGEPADLSNGSVAFSMRDAAGALKVSAQPCIVVPPLVISGLVRTGAIALVTTADVHGFARQQQVLHVGAAQAEYNGAFEILSVPTPDTYVISVRGSPGALSGSPTTTRAFVRYLWGASDTDTAGVYRGVFRAVLASGLPISFPSDGAVLINIEEP